MELDKALIETIINMLDEVIECNNKQYRYPFSDARIKEITDKLISLLEEGE